MLTGPAAVLAAPLELLTLTPDQGVDLLAAGQALRSGNTTVAMARYRNACRSNPDLPPVPRLLLARQLLALGRIDEGRAQLELVAAEEDPIPPELHLSLGHLAVLDGRLKEAELHYQRAESLAARTVARPTRRQLAEREALAGRSELAMLRGDWAVARRLLERRLAQAKPGEPGASAKPGEPGASATGDSQRAGLHASLGTVLVRLGDAAAALEQFRLSAAADASQTLPELAMAQALSQTDASAAESWLTRAVTEHPRDARAHAAHGAWLLERDQVREADAAIARAASLDRESPSVKRLRGLVARAAGRPAEAEFCFAELLERSPSDAAVAEQLAQALCDQDSDDKRRRGLELAQSNWRQYPSSPTAAATLGWALLRTGQPQPALTALERAVQLAEGRLLPEVAYFVAHGLAHVGRVEDARRTLRQAVAAPGFFAYRAAARAWLAGLEAPARPRP